MAHAGVQKNDLIAQRAKRARAHPCPLHGDSRKLRRDSRGRHDAPVGFVRLVKNDRRCEILLVIGERDNWGRKLGASAVREGMQLAFFES